MPKTSGVLSVLASVCLPLGLLTGCGHSADTTSKRASVEVSVSSCGAGWKQDSAGPQHLMLRNTDSRAGDVRVVAPTTGAVYAEIEPFGAGTTRALDVTLAPGTYAVQCLMDDEPPVTGSAVRLTKPTSGAVTDPAPGVVPADQQQLIAPTLAYQRYVQKALPGLIDRVTALRTSVASGSRTKAQRDWLRAHLSYERLGAAYDAFGDVDGAINGLARGLPKRTSDPDFTGFHALEQRLWNGAPVRSGLALADRLVTDVRGLQRQFARAQIDPLTLTIRAHEITENALQFALTGEDDYGSHTGLATVEANLDGTRTVLRILAPLLDQRHLDTASLTSSVSRTQALLADQHHGTRWTGLGGLSRADREHIDADMSQLSERLADVAAVLEPRRTS